MRLSFWCFFLVTLSLVAFADDSGEASVPVEAQTFSTQVSFTGFTKPDVQKVQQAIDIIKKVVASAEFRSRVLNFSYNGKNEFVDNKGLTNAQIYQILLDGAETLLPQPNNQMDLDLELYYEDTTTIGYTYPDVLKIWMNKKFFWNYTPIEVSNNIFHEWTHKLGFDHDIDYSPSRDASVPYALGYLIEELGKKYQ